MPFTILAFNQQLLLDNPTYERFQRSDLHNLVEMLRRVPPMWTPAQVAIEMKKISAVKWTKYARTRAYLVREIMGLANLLRAVPINFTTTGMQSEMGDTILRHTFKWDSDTGNLADLANAYTRENVTWPQWPGPLTACIGLPHGAEYTHAGNHTGLANNRANVGSGRDDHSLLGPFNQTILTYTGPTLQAPMTQVYEYSYDQVNWLPIANSNYTIVREVEAMPGNKVKLKLTKTNTTKPGDRFSISKIF